MSRIGIYKITNKINGKCYIGQSQNVFKRWSVHGNKNKANNCNMVIAKAITKHGVENFTFEILELCTKNELNSKEAYWVSKYDSYNQGYNSTTGGDSPDEVAFSKLSKSNVEVLYSQLLDNTIPIVELAKMYGVTESTVRSVNTGDSWVKEDIDYPIRQGNSAYLASVVLPKKYCSCGVEIVKNSVTGLCKKCCAKSKRKVTRPTKVVLIAEILQHAKTTLGLKYGVSDNTIKKWCKAYNIPHSKNGFKCIKWYDRLDSNQHESVTLSTFAG